MKGLGNSWCIHNMLGWRHWRFVDLISPTKSLIDGNQRHHTSIAKCPKWRNKKRRGSEFGNK